MKTVQVRPKANKKNVVLWKDKRITVLTDRLFRIETSKNCKFNDYATQGVFYRDMKPNKFTITQTDDSIMIATERTLLQVYKKTFDSTVTIDGKQVKISNKGNLLSAFRTLDGCDGGKFAAPNAYGKPIGSDVKLENGVCSTTGVAVLDDGKSLYLTEDGKMMPNYNQEDIYVFAYGKDYKQAVKDFYMIEGSIPMVPRYAFGNWWSRYFDYTDRSYLAVLNGFEDHGVPLSVATIDMDWHYSDNVDKQKKVTETVKKCKSTFDEMGYPNGWTGYSWNKEFFPDPKSFLKKVKEKGLAITLNIHPADGVRFWEDCYNEFALSMGIDAKDKKWIKFDLTNEKFTELYFKLLHHPNEDMGVDFWWIDWQQGLNSGIEGLDPLWWLNHYHYLDNEERHGQGLILSRYNGAGSHRYPVGFSGDTAVTWNTLEYLPYFTATGANIGYTLWSHDIGGHHHGARDEELYLRSIQFGVFSPINRLHSTKVITIEKEPWSYVTGAGEIAEKYLKLRHRLVPYIYSEVNKNCLDNEVWLKPLYYEYPDDENAYKFKNEYFFGSQLIVIPITKKSDGSGWTEIDAYIPEGNWTDIFTGEKYTKGKRKITRPLNDTCVLIREGGILPLAKESSENGCEIPKHLEVKVYKGNGVYGLRESADGNSGINFTSAYKNGVQTLTIKAFGKQALNNRTLRIDFADIIDEKITEYVDKESVVPLIRESENACVIIENFDSEKQYKIIVKEKPMSKLDYLKKMAKFNIVRVNGGTWARNDVYVSLKKCETEKEFIKTLNAFKDFPLFVNKMKELI